ncbi:hypothetical protein E2C01_014587 [Portunus trituberculatus]|uniref:Uncharacterized protein n=1 Tax=Portunus trituberculatus TaxID=210409 RepID=A0A5B7DKK8_PORTR|nr:hypothetical protein [Portunus trituberculatus]
MIRTLALGDLSDPKARMVPKFRSGCPEWYSYIYRHAHGLVMYGYIPYQRHTVPNIIIGAIVGKLSQYACTQTTVQRYASMKNLTHSYM